MRYHCHAGQIRIGETLSCDVPYDLLKAVLIVHLTAMVESENLLIHVVVYVIWLYGNIGSNERTLQETPEVLDTLCVNPSIDVLVHMVDGTIESNVL